MKKFMVDGLLIFPVVIDQPDAIQAILVTVIANPKVFTNIPFPLF